MSKVEVDQITQQSGTTLTVGGGACKTAVVDATTVTLGRCGGTVSLASGATQSGFGRTGTVDWETTPKVTGDSPVTAVSGTGYFLNTTGGAITINLPAGSAGDIVSMADYAATWQTYSVTVSPNGDVLVAEDGDLMRLFVIVPNEPAKLLMQITKGNSEITGPAFTPDGSRLYFSSQRGPSGVDGSGNGGAVSYTHLTLPTILLV